MENKLEQLTQKLYNEGLERGRTEAERLIAEAGQEAAEIVAAGHKEADRVVKQAEAHAVEVEKNAMTEIALAGKQAATKIKAEIASLIVTKSISAGVKEAVSDPEFIKNILLSIAKNWSGANYGKVELKALLPETERARLDAAFAGDTAELLKAGIEVGYSNRVKTGFKVGAKEGGYYISFTDADFNALIGEYLNEKVAELLFKQA